MLKPGLFWLAAALTITSGGLLGAQEPAEPAPPLPVIADEPKLIDPASMMPAKLAAVATVDLRRSSLAEVIEWLQTKQGISVVVDHRAIDGVGLLLADPVSDQLNEEPVYLLLNRLRTLGIGWFYENDVLRLTTTEAADSEHMTTIPYNVGDLLDADYKEDRLSTIIPSVIAPETWDEVGGPGGINMIGDVIFVRQSDRIHRQVQGLLSALRKHGRRTYVLDPPQHLVLREKLKQKISVDFKETALEDCVRQIGALLKADLRLDHPALQEVGLRPRLPMSLTLEDRSAKTILDALSLELELTPLLRDGVLWLTNRDHAYEHALTAVYDVRDLCLNQQESQALEDALMSQTSPDMWSDVGGPGEIEFAKPGVMVVGAPEYLHDEVLNMLETYRAALRASKPRDRHLQDPQDIITVYYRTHTIVATDLEKTLPLLIPSDHWPGGDRPEAEGKILRLSAAPEPIKDPAPGDDPSATTALAQRSVLIITQTRAVHEKIEEVLREVDPVGFAPVFNGGMGGFGGGGFGGGFFNLPSQSMR